VETRGTKFIGGCVTEENQGTGARSASASVKFIIIGPEVDGSLCFRRCLRWKWMGRVGKELLPPDRPLPSWLPVLRITINIGKTNILLHRPLPQVQPEHQGQDPGNVLSVVQVQTPPTITISVNPPLFSNSKLIYVCRYHESENTGQETET
jgi:hypothetical protein